MVGEDPHLFAANQAQPAERRSPVAWLIPRSLAPAPMAVGPVSTTETLRATTDAVALTGATGTGTADVADADAAPSTRPPPPAEEVPPSPARPRGRSFLTWGVGSYVLVLGVILALAARESQGNLIYVLDDPAIHQSIAQNLVDHGTWGVEAGHFQSASSSPLWTVLLAAYLVVAPFARSAGPLVLNVLASVAVIAILAGNQSVLRPSRRRPADAVAVAVLVTVVLFLPGLTLVGMEHVAHMALVLGAVALFHRQGAGELARWPRWLPYLLVALATLVRIETLFVALGLAVALLARCLSGWGPDGLAARRRAQALRALLVAAAAVIPLAAVAASNRLAGQGWLPNSILAKSRVDDPDTPLYRLPVERLTTDPLVGVLTVVLLVALVLLWRQPRRFAFPAIVTVVTVAGHVALARIGWYERYQAYLLVIAVYAALQLAGEVVATAPKPVARPALGAVLVLAMLPFCGTKVFLTVDAPLAVADTYEQRYQAGRFLARYYDGEPVATGELGYVSVLHDGPITDLFGLGDYEVLQARMDAGPRPPATYWERLTAERGFEVAAVYPSTLGLETPPGWMLAGWWSLPRRTVSAFEPRFEFWATSPEALLRLQDHLRDFADDLPEGVEVTVNEPAAEQAVLRMAADEPPA
jgi:hypothetical protein